ncbi:14828_t:CDS:2 [Funneliformis mosseae]|uniref:14828_t:CDS:1 n=1 Tax=Funneliformis mosseae TaxID=27381 RepID=A0A9N9I3D3_FUNMO|nr:14828_t:CDS:2 [Funneliformis mosseae]
MVQEETPLEENSEDTDLKFRYDLLSADHEHLKKLLTQYFSLLSQEQLEPPRDEPTGDESS